MKYGTASATAAWASCTSGSTRCSTGRSPSRSSRCPTTRPGAASCAKPGSPPGCTTLISSASTRSVNTRAIRTWRWSSSPAGRWRRSSAAATQVPLARKVHWLSELCAGLGHAHDSGIVHRDVKPSNLLIAQSTGTLRLLDFGIAHGNEASSMTMAGMIVGTPQYMSPEQITGQPVDARSDIFSVGAVAYELLTGRQAFGGDNLYHVSRQIVGEQPRPIESFVPDVPERAGQDHREMPAEGAGDRAPSSAKVLEREFLAHRPPARSRAHAGGACRPEPTMVAPQAKDATTSRRELLREAEEAIEQGELTTASGLLQKLESGTSPNPDVQQLRQKLQGRRLELRVQEARRAGRRGAPDRLARGGRSGDQRAGRPGAAPSGARAAAHRRTRSGIDERQVAALTSRARQALQQDRLDEAESLLAEALALAPDAADALAVQQKLSDRTRAQRIARLVAQASRALDQDDAVSARAGHRRAGAGSTRRTATSRGCRHASRRSPPTPSEAHAAQRRAGRPVGARSAGAEPRQRRRAGAAARAGRPPPPRAAAHRRRRRARPPAVAPTAPRRRDRTPPVPPDRRPARRRPARQRRRPRRRAAPCATRPPVDAHEDTGQRDQPCDRRAEDADAGAASRWLVPALAALALLVRARRRGVLRVRGRPADRRARRPAASVAAGRGRQPRHADARRPTTVHGARRRTAADRRPTPAGARPRCRAGPGDPRPATAPPPVVRRAERAARPTRGRPCVSSPQPAGTTAPWPPSIRCRACPAALMQEERGRVVENARRYTLAARRGAEDLRLTKSPQYVLGTTRQAAGRPRSRRPAGSSRRSAATWPRAVTSCRRSTTAARRRRPAVVAASATRSPTTQPRRRRRPAASRDAGRTGGVDTDLDVVQRGSARSHRAVLRRLPRPRHRRPRPPVAQHGAELAHRVARGVRDQRRARLRLRERHASSATSDEFIATARLLTQLPGGEQRRRDLVSRWSRPRPPRHRQHQGQVERSRPRLGSCGITRSTRRQRSVSVATMPACHHPRRGHQALRPDDRPSTRCRCRCPKAPSTASSGRTAPARRRRCG